MTTSIFSPSEFRLHDMGAGHPECPQRLDAIGDHLRATGLDAVLQWHDAPDATAEQLAHAHTAAYVADMLDRLQRVKASGQAEAVDPDTSVYPGTAAAALKAAGAAVAATDAVLSGAVSNAFCAVRPPGHHATRGQAMGFCFFNNVVVAARHALAQHGLQRVAVIDFDVHHGNGTEDIVAGDERILMCSFFQSPLYPYSGTQPMADNMVNVPLPPYSRGPQMREAVEQQWLPRLEQFAPQMVFISAGFDAHREDELGQLGLVEADYTWLTEQLVALARRHAHGRIVSCLEGGYALSALARSVASHLRVLSAAA